MCVFPQYKKKLEIVSKSLFQTLNNYNNKLPLLNMSLNKLIQKVNKMMPFEVSILNDPVAVSSCDGTITDVNQMFTKTFVGFTC